MKMEERHGRKQRAVDSCTRFCWVPSWNSTLIIDIHSFIKKYKSSQNFVNVTLDLVPHPVTVTTRTVTFLARDPYQHPHPNVTRKKAKKKTCWGTRIFRYKRPRIDSRSMLGCPQLCGAPKHWKISGFREG